jgi:succinate dehydrogenase flavin-adding protein (antitoxin of CptAB toxin-antitoxin module)|tara:strand:- start:2206 stop:2418 length:213 start_codon:yes stop_codon:yes gene_type:complete
MDVVNWAKHMYKVLNEREQDIARSLLAGSAKDWDQYKMMVGEARGLSFAKEEIKALLENNADDIEDLISS